MKHCVIIGGGIVGLSCAYFLNKAGHQVTVIDQGAMDGGASYVNAGYLAPSHIIPLSSPGMMKKGLKWMFNASSPLYIKPRLDTDFLQWAMAFNRSCNPTHVKRAIPAIKDISLLSRELYESIRKDEDFSFQLEKKGLLMLCQTEKALEAEAKVIDLAKAEDLPCDVLTAGEIKKLMPQTKMDILGGTFYECDYHTTPHEFMEELKILLVKRGVTIRKNEMVLDFAITGEKVTHVKTERQDVIKADEFVLAAGSWTPLLAKKLGLKILLQAGKGYRINTTTSTGITLPAILAEAKVAVTPMNGFTRFAGTMEIAGINQKINHVRVEAIARAATRYFPEVSLTAKEKQEAQSGLRPVTPDGLPYIGRTSKCKNLTFATGHAMMGWSLGPATGLLVSEVIDDKKPSLNLSLYMPERKF